MSSVFVFFINALYNISHPDPGRRSMRYYLLLFDLDGTLVDSRESIRQSMRLTLEKLGVPGTPESRDRLNGKPLGEALKLAGVKDVNEAVEVYRSYYFDLQEKIEKLYPGVKDMLHSLYDRAEMAIVTNKGPRGTENALVNNGIKGYFSHVFCDNGGPVKPDPALLDVIMEKYAHEGKFYRKEDILMVGDSPVDIEFAFNCGIDSLYVGGHGEWGFYRPNELEKAPTYTISESMELLRITGVDQPAEWETGPELDLHTFKPADVPAVLESYLAESVSKGLREVRIIHGKGLFIQRERVRKLLKKSSNVTCIMDAPPFLGGYGATIVKLKSVLNTGGPDDTQGKDPENHS